jgi:predicted dehydrogenase
VAIIGAGKIGTTHARAWSRLPGAEIVALADTRPEAARELAQAVGATEARIYSDTESLLAAQGGGIDAVSICVPTPLHRAVSEAAFAAGVSVLCEKPMALTALDCDAMIAAADAAGVVFTVGQVVRFFPEFANAKRLVDSGAVGAPASVRTRRGGDFPHRNSDWYADVAQSGGVIVDLLVHDIDWAQWCFGPILRVYAQGLTERLADKRLHHLDYALLTCRHAGGVVSHLEATWADPGGFVTTFEIAGDGGLLSHDSRKSAALTKSVRGEGSEAAKVNALSSPLAQGEDPYYQQIAAFAAAVRGEAPVAVRPQEARQAIAVAQAARESLRTGTTVTVRTGEMVNIGILSAAHGHANSYAAQLRAMPNTTLVGLWDSDSARLAARSADYGCEAFGEIPALLEQCDAVMVCAENVHHRALTLAAAQAGKPVLCEKPLATTPTMPARWSMPATRRMSS